MNQMNHQIFWEELVNYHEDMYVCFQVDWFSNVQTPVKN